MAKIIPGRFLIFPRRDQTSHSHTGSKATYEWLGFEKIGVSDPLTAKMFAEESATRVREVAPDGREYIWVERLEREMHAFSSVELQWLDRTPLDDAENLRVFRERVFDRLAYFNFAGARERYLRAMGDATVIGAYLFALEHDQANEVSNHLLANGILWSAETQFVDLVFSKPSYFLRPRHSLFAQYRIEQPMIARQIERLV